jgi:Kef-type K+ transport system membrane component KefB
MMVRASFALMLTFATLAEMANLEIILGAFLAGILYSFLFKTYRNEIQPKLEAIGYGFLIPVFFIMIGVTFDFKILLTPQVYLLLPLLLYIAYIVKLIPALILRKYFGWRETLGAGFLLSARLSLIIAISLIALKEGLISQSIHSALIIVAMITCLLSPIIFMQFASKC